MNSRTGDTEFRIGDLLNNTFRIEAILGSGGTSEVFRARNEISGRLVALKVLKAEFADKEDFLVLMKREEEMRDIRHHAVVGYSENHRTADGHVYLVMDYVDGPSLEDKMKAGGMPPEELLIVGRRVAEGLQAAHERRIVHRDLSPDNIILKNGDPAAAVIIDFGIAKDANPGAKTIVGTEFAGKFSYAAPEQFGGMADARTDIYALGMTLLATFRGKSPRLGGSLIEMLEVKKQAVDLTDVPQPFAGLLARMLDPSPAARFQSCQEILDEIDRITGVAPAKGSKSGAGSLPPGLLGLPSSEPAPRSNEKPEPPKKNKPAKAKPEPKGKRSLLPGLLAVLLLVALGAGGWFFYSTQIASRLPLADPFVLTAERGEIGGPVLNGTVPTQEMLDSLVQRATRQNGSQNLSLARGDISEGWPTAVASVLNAVDALNSYNLRVDGNSITISGHTTDAGVNESLQQFLRTASLPDGMQLSGQIDFIPPILPVAEVQAIVETASDCGALQLISPPGGGYGIDDTIEIAGTLSGPEARQDLFDLLSSVAEGRDISITTELLNPALCVIEGQLPNLPSQGIEVALEFGATGNPNPSGEFFVGENPVIDVVLPASLQDGYLYVSIIDVTGSVFHLLPNVARPDNSVANLRNGQSGAVPIRVAYPRSEAASDKIAFLVDDSLLGKSKVLVLHSATPIFDTFRPISESAEGYAEALKQVNSGGGVTIDALDSRLLTLSVPG
ncbi:serine/threonine protein kinase [Aliiruegeria sabulilitoris]|uniref:serine/threonine protein kinase n=1 Tax=Aliiruegeria sabulilitoris TaxID=1510458 RepID=UPI00083577AB|nr:serine/threonine protein kinase [Aliiruegeria sabulilitoris]NDR59032.1 protein kinase [Pseudoruegeria sp. M32A2M]